jgi:hypothetical protein
MNYAHAFMQELGLDMDSARKAYEKDDVSLLALENENNNLHVST